MIQFADKAMIPLLKVIWQEAFKDDDIYTNFFYENRFTNDNTLVWVEDEKPVAMLTLLPAQMNVQGKPHPVKYIYGVATKFEYRGRGISTALLNYANNQADSDNEILILVPSSEKLFGFYKKCGYNTYFYVKELTINEEQFEHFPKLNYEISGITAAEYKEIRDNCFMKSGYISWDIHAIDYILRANELSGGTCVKLTLGGTPNILMYYKNDTVLQVIETSLYKDIILPILSDIAKKEKCNTVHARLPDSFDLGVSNRAFGMLYSKTTVDISSNYLNLVLD